jgi:hypothetical protein
MIDKSMSWNALCFEVTTPAKGHRSIVLMMRAYTRIVGCLEMKLDTQVSETKMLFAHLNVGNHSGVVLHPIR